MRATSVATGDPFEWLAEVREMWMETSGQAKAE